MRYMIIVKATRDSEAGVMPTEQMFHAMASYHEELARAGVLVDASGLRASSLGWRVEYQGEHRTVVDGPFAETKELIAGFTLIQVKSKAEAIEWVRRWPIEDGDVQLEIRQVYEAEDFGPAMTAESKEQFDRLLPQGSKR